MSLVQVFISEVLGTAMLLLLGAGVVANVVLPKNRGFGNSFLLINFGWGLAVMAGVYVAFKSGGHLNPAVTLGLLANGADEYAKGIPVNVGSTLTYLAAEFIGAFIGAILAWAAYKKQFDEREDANSLGVFCTSPTIPSVVWNLVTEILGTFVLVFVVIALGKTPSDLGPLIVGLLVLGIGASLGGPTGYAINPARDLGPRIAHAILPIPNKSGNDWGYAWIPVVGPIIGGVLAGLLAAVYVV